MAPTEITVTIPDPLDVPIGEPLELVAVGIKSMGIRCKTLNSGIPVTLKKCRFEVEGEILTVRPSRVWQFKRTNYMSGEVLATRVDIAALKRVPLKLTQVGTWNPEEEGFTSDEDLHPRLKAFVGAAPRSEFEMEQILPGCSDSSDPILEACEYFGCGAEDKANRIMEKLLSADMRCLDAHAHLGNFAFEQASSPTSWYLDKALKNYGIGVKIGELSLGPDFDGVLPWGWIDNRPFLRCLHGYALCLWRKGDLTAAEREFRRLLNLNPNDNQGVRFLLDAIDRGDPWTEDC